MIIKKKLQILFDESRITLNASELEECQLFANWLIKKEKKLTTINKVKKNKEKKRKTKIENYLINLWGNNFPFLSFSKLERLSRGWKDYLITEEIRKKNCLIDDEGFILFKNRKN